MISDLDIEAAEAAVTEARRKAAAMRKSGASDVADLVTREEGRLADLKERKERQDAALRERKAVEKTHAAELREIGKILDDSAVARWSPRQRRKRPTPLPGSRRCWTSTTAPPLSCTPAWRPWP